MALPRHASRFFATFYRWNKYSHSPSHCAYATRARHDIPRRLPKTAVRGFSSSKEDTRVGKELDPEEDTQPFVEHMLGDHGYTEDQNDITETISAKELKPKAAGEEDDEMARAALKEREVLEGDIAAQDYVDERKKPPVADSLRSVMRIVPHPVVVITAGQRGMSVMPAQGMVLSSFNTVSLDPPSVSFNIRLPSRTWESIKADHGFFRVHILRASKSAAFIADAMSKGDAENAFKVIGKWVMLATDSISATIPGSTLGKQKRPIMRPRKNDNAIEAVLDCTISHEIEVGDHVVAVARVHGVRPTASMQSALIYSHGGFAQRGSNLLHPLKDYVSPEKRYLSLPVFPGKSERLAMKGWIEKHLKNNTHLLNMPHKDAIGAIERAFQLPSGGLGIKIRGIIAKRDDRPVLPEFWGSLSAREIETIANRAVNFVRQDPSFLETHHQFLMNLLDVDSLSTLFARDIMERLRAEGLVGPFEPFPEDWKGDLDPAMVTLPIMEKVEHRVLEVCRKDPNSYLLRIETIARRAKVKFLARYLASRRPRFVVETAKQFANMKQYDIRDEVSLEEKRIVVARLMRYFLTNKDFYGVSPTPPWNILRRCNIHPAVSNVDPYFLLSKARHLAEGEDLKTARDKIWHAISHWFEKNVSPKQLEERITALVEKHPRHAVRLTRRELLSAIGLRDDAQMQNDDSAHTEIKSSHVLDNLVREALRRKYDGIVSEDELVNEYIHGGNAFRSKRVPGQTLGTLKPTKRHVRTSNDGDNSSRGSQAGGPPDATQTYSHDSLISQHKIERAENPVPEESRHVSIRKIDEQNAKRQLARTEERKAMSQEWWANLAPESRAAFFADKFREQRQKQVENIKSKEEEDERMVKERIVERLAKRRMGEDKGFGFTSYGLDGVKK